MQRTLITISTTAVMIASCGNPTNPSKESAMNKNHSVDLANFDTTAVPADNFYEYVNGNWLKNNPVPPTEASWNNFSVIHNENLAKIHTLLEEAAADKKESDSSEQKVGSFYATAMDSIKLNQEGIKPLDDEFKRIASIQTVAELPAVIAHLHIIGMKPLFEINIGADAKASTQNITTINQGGLGLPDMDYYLSKDPSVNTIREKYRSYIANMFRLEGETEGNAALIAGKIFELEKQLAQESMTRVQLRNIEAQYNKKTLKEFTRTATNIDWMSYFKVLNIDTKVENIIIGQPKFFERVSDLFRSVPIADWKNYLRWNLINGSASKLSDNFVQESFNFYGTVLSGSKNLKPRWKRAVQQTDASMGDLLGRLFIEKYFSPEAKKKINEMVDNLTAAYQVRISTRDWMSAETKKQALHKLATVMRKLGYPDKWRDYSALEIKRDSYIMNFFRANAFDFKYMTDKLGKPVDKTEWGMSTPTVNAYYNPSYNEIVFPAGIMQIPFFDPNADDAVNYGAIGAVIGHELTHGFDDQGCQYDADGNLKNWWTKEDSLKFQEKTNKIVDQFNQFKVLDTLHINGQLTLGENIADLGGLTIAYYAYQKSLEGKPAPEKINGFTGDQRFFISWAQAWRGNMRPEYLKQLIKTNPHAPNIARVMAPLSNMKEFYQAFNVKEGNAMFRAAKDRPEIW
jgi:putative endopeptidase